jgi:hypothetical protein
MDSGCAAFDSEGEDEFDPTRDVSAEEAIWLMDELLYREVGSMTSAAAFIDIVYRLRGIWVTHCLRHCSPRYTLNDCFGPNHDNSQTSLSGEMS